MIRAVTGKSVLLFLILFFALSCEKAAEPVVPSLSVGGISDDRISVEAGFSGSVPITVESNVGWSSSSDASWVKLSPSEGRGGEFCEVSVCFTGRNWSDERSATITITAGDKEYSFSALQAKYDPIALGYDNPESVTDGHPFLLASGSEFTRIRKAATAEGSVLGVLHNYIMRYAEISLSLKPVKYELSGNRLLSVCAEALKRIFYLSYAYRVTGNPEYASRVESELLAISDFPDWNPSNFIEPSEMMFATAIAYDWCYPRLSATTKEKALDALKSKGLDPYFVWTGANNNFNQVCNTGALYGSYVYNDRDSSYFKAVTDRSTEMIKIALRGYNPGGTYVEGPGYWCYGTSYNTLFFDILKRHFGDTRGLLEEFPCFLKTADYANAVITPSFKVFDYSDQGFAAQVSIVPFYIYDLTGREESLSTQFNMLSKSMLNYDHCRHERLLPAAIVYAARRGVENVREARIPSSFVGDGETPFASLRGSSYLGIKLGHPDTGHGHMDIGTFCFESDGVQWSTDMGGESYSTIESAGVNLWSYAQGSDRWSLMRCGPHGHSVLLFDGSEQLVSARGYFLSEATSNPDDMSVVSNLTRLYSDHADSVTRTIRLVDGLVGEISDFITAGAAPTLLRWNMVSEASEASFDASGATLLSSRGPKLRMDVSGLDNFIMKQWSSTPSRSCESPNSQIIVGFEAPLESGRTYNITVRLTPQK